MTSASGLVSCGMKFENRMSSLTSIMLHGNDCRISTSLLVGHVGPVTMGLNLRSLGLGSSVYFFFFFKPSNANVYT